jgi:hypothetical protein
MSRRNDVIDEWINTSHCVLSCGSKSRRCVFITSEIFNDMKSMPLIWCHAGDFESPEESSRKYERRKQKKEMHASGHTIDDGIVCVHLHEHNCICTFRFTSGSSPVSGESKATHAPTTKNLDSASVRGARVVAGFELALDSSDRGFRKRRPKQT